MGEQTVFVIGAGASKEVGLPTGDELKNLISKSLDIDTDAFDRKATSGDSLICETLIREVPDGLTYLPAAHHIRDAMPQAESIDNFIYQHQGDKKIELCGKLAIVRSILVAERRRPGTDRGGKRFFHQVNGARPRI